jgi:hypothetical protein
MGKHCEGSSTWAQAGDQQGSQCHHGNGAANLERGGHRHQNQKQRNKGGDCCSSCRETGPGWILPLHRQEKEGTCTELPEAGRHRKIGQGLIQPLECHKGQEGGNRKH